MRKFLIVGLLASIAALYSAPSADAAFAIRYTQNGGATVVINDNAAGDNNPLVDIININIPGLGTFVAGGSTGLVNEGAFLTLMDLQANGSWTNAVGTESLVIDLTRTDIDTAPAPQTLTHNFTGSLLGLGSGTLTAQWWVDDANGLFALTAPTSGNLAVPNGPTNTAINVTGPYSATLRLSVINVTGTVSLSADNNISITGVPGPSALVLALAALPGAGVMYLRRRKQA